MKKLNRRPNRFRGQTLGLDLHKQVLRYALLNRAGDEVVNEEVAADRDMLRRVVREYQQEGPVQVVLEASGCFLWAYDLLVELVGREHVHVAAPSRVRVIADGVDVNPSSPYPESHYTIYPSERMPGDRFTEMYNGLPWIYGGKK